MYVASNECEAKIQRQELDRRGVRVPDICPFCKTHGEYRNITGDRTKTCPDYISECPNTGCDKRMRSQMAEHRNEYPKEIVSCHYSSIGCNTMIKREELLSQDQECMSSHLDLEIHKLRAQRHKNAKLFTE